MKRYFRTIIKLNLAADIIVYLENYAIGETPHVSIRRAVDEAKKILADLKRQNHRHADIAARWMTADCAFWQQRKNLKSSVRGYSSP